ncbi:putative acyl-CoA dehydrogenase [Trichinella spiralis]|uniref:putative acyl-CoA dehydrogenase n=1 Tax=Trichinella spiralis TaxID=6334 RepID=UPI0001EFEFFE|nr:putative acyl-CoA dehydrogenase [Trichinella spiralis]
MSAQRSDTMKVVLVHQLISWKTLKIHIVCIIKLCCLIRKGSAFVVVTGKLIVSVNQFDLLVVLTRECEAWQKIIGCLFVQTSTKGKNHKRH